jgi:hypothetical protein
MIYDHKPAKSGGWLDIGAPHAPVSLEYIIIYIKMITIK